MDQMDDNNIQSYLLNLSSFCSLQLKYLLELDIFDLHVFLGGD